MTRRRLTPAERAADAEAEIALLIARHRDRTPRRQHPGPILPPSAMQQNTARRAQWREDDAAAAREHRGCSPETDGVRRGRIV